MNNLQGEKVCPSCGSRNIEVKHEGRQQTLPFAAAVSYDATIDSCRDCEMVGDFLGINDKAIAPLLDNAKKESVASIIGGLVDNQKFSMAYMERALDLPARTMMRWKSGDYSAAALALLRIVGTYPWTIEVADAQFDKPFAIKRLAQEGVNAMLGMAEIHNVGGHIEINFEDMGAKGSFSLYSKGIGLSAISTGTTAAKPAMIEGTR